MAQDHEERRRLNRILFDAEATLEDERQSFPCKVLDLSLRGCLLRFERPWQGSLETLYTLTLKLSDSVNITMKLGAVHVVANEAGFKCEHIDIDAIARLRRLVELNLGDDALLERDMLALSELPSY